MNRIEISRIYKTPQEFSGKSITVCGWVKTIRDSKSIGFMEISDGSSFKGLQVVFEEAKLANFKDIAKQNVGAAVCVTGILVLTPQAGQPFEINAQDIDNYSLSIYQRLKAIDDYTDFGPEAVSDSALGL